MGYNSAVVIVPKDRENDPFEYVKELSDLRSSDEFRSEEGEDGEPLHISEPDSMQIGGYRAGQFVGKTPRDNPGNLRECLYCGGRGKIDIDEFAEGIRKFWSETAENVLKNPNHESSKEELYEEVEKKVEEVYEKFDGICPQCKGHGTNLEYWSNLESKDPNDDLERVDKLLEKIESEEYNIGFGIVITPENKVYGWDQTFDILHSKWANGEIEREDIGKITWERMLYILRQYKDHLVVNVTAHQ
jgi:hypothetical protein